MVSENLLIFFFKFYDFIFSFFVMKQNRNIRNFRIVSYFTLCIWFCYVYCINFKWIGLTVFEIWWRKVLKKDVLIKTRLKFQLRLKRWKSQLIINVWCLVCKALLRISLEGLWLSSYFWSRWCTLYHDFVHKHALCSQWSISMIVIIFVLLGNLHWII